MSNLHISQKGIDLITSFEGFSSKPYQVKGAGEIYYTWGFGHYGSDVPSPTSGKTITKEQAITLLKQDLARFEGYVNGLNLSLNQHQFDSLVSFSYNCGPSNLKSLVKDRTLSQIADGILLYNKAGGHILNGLVKRRQSEHDLFVSPVPKPKLPVPTSTLKIGSKGEQVKELQTLLNHFGFKCAVDGDFGSGTKQALQNFQKIHLPHEVDGIYGDHTEAIFHKLV